MGGGPSRSRTDYEILVRTRDAKKAGTDSNVYITLIDKDGRQSSEQLINCTFTNDFEQGNEDSFKIQNVKNLGRISKILLRKDSSGLYDDWFVEYIKVRQFTTAPDVNDNGAQPIYDEDGIMYPFPINRWIKADRKYTFSLYDSFLPQDDVNKEQRNMELLEKREKYVFGKKDPGMPRRVKICPDEENFSNSYKWDITGRKLKLLAESTLMKFFSSSQWDSLDEMDEVYKASFGRPAGFLNWKLDEEFGQQRLRGCNSRLIKMCEGIPANFAVTPEMVQPFLDGKSLNDALKDGEIFIADLNFLEGVVCKDNRTICPAMALFHAKENGNMMPIAIQLFQQPSETNPVFLPSDPEYTWMAAKIYFNNADCSYHQSCSHLGFTHLVVESIAVSIHRTLSPSHPVYRLIAPHFLYLIAINSLAVEKLISEGGWIDLTMTMGVKGLLDILGRRWSEWRLDYDGWLPNDLKARKVDDKEKVKSYLYRDDALKLHEAILNYVTEVVTNAYNGSDEKLKEDNEIQNFAFTLVDPEDGAGIKGVFGNGKFDDLDDLIKTVTSIIFLSSVEHAAVNFCQYDEYAFPPNYPALLYKEPPTTKEPLTEQFILDAVPNRDTTLSIMVVTTILSERATNGLGDFEIQYQYNPKAVAAVERFRENLKKISEEIVVRNLNMDNPYPYLDPKEIPNAISI